jgi:hypothetical protein
VKERSFTGDDRRMVSLVLFLLLLHSVFWVVLGLVPLGVHFFFFFGQTGVMLRLGIDRVRYGRIVV